MKEVDDMKRIKAACICQTLHFALKEEAPYDETVRLIDAEVAAYKDGLDKHKTKYRLVDERRQADGSVLLRIIKQYNDADVGSYLD